MFETLLKLDGVNDNMKAEIEKIQAQVAEKMNADKAKIESLSTQFEDVKNSRDAKGKGLKALKELLGIEKVEEAQEKLEALKGGNDDKAQAELINTIQTLKKDLETKNSEVNDIKTGYEQKMTDFEIKLAVDAGINAHSETLVDDPFIRDAFKQEVLKGIGKVGDSISPYEQVGDNKIPIKNGDKNMSVDEYVGKLLGSDKFLSLNKTKVEASAGSTNGGGGNENADVSKMSPSEKFKYYEQKQG